MEKISKLRILGADAKTNTLTLLDEKSGNVMTRRMKFRDGLMTFDTATIDSTGAFLVGELEQLDQTMHEPLADYSWSRDIDVREDVSIADETSSFTNSAFAAIGGSGSGGGANGTTGGKAWIGKESNMIQRIALDIAKTAHPLYLWGMELSYTIPELESAIRLGRPIDTQKYTGIMLKYQMDVDQQVYLGDTELGQTGLVNSGSVTYALVANGAYGGTAWNAGTGSGKTPDEIVNDIITLCNATWKASGYAVYPSRLLLPPAQWGYVGSQKISTAGNETILSYIEDKVQMCLRLNGKKLEVLPVKWLAGAGETVSGTATDRMVAYTKDIKRVRVPLVPMQRTPLEFRSIWHITTYFCRIGVVEVVYSETMAYADGI